MSYPLDQTLAADSHLYSECSPLIVSHTFVDKKEVLSRDQSRGWFIWIVGVTRGKALKWNSQHFRKLAKRELELKTDAHF